MYGSLASLLAREIACRSLEFNCINPSRSAKLFHILYGGREGSLVEFDENKTPNACSNFPLFTSPAIRNDFQICPEAL